MSILVVLATMLAGLPMIGVGVYLVCVGMAVQKSRRGVIALPRPLLARIETVSAAIAGKSVIVLGAIMILVGLAMPIWAWTRLAGMMLAAPMGGR